MARLPLSLTEVSVAGTDPHPTAANTDGHSVVWARDIALVVRTGATTTNLTIDVPLTVNGLAIADRGPVAIPINSTRIFPLGAAEYRQTDGTVSIDYSAITNVTVGVIRLPSL